MTNHFVIIFLALQSLNPLCFKRGHAQSGWAWVTLANSAIETVDLPDRTLRIKYDPNKKEYTCARCGFKITEPVQVMPDTTVIWKRQ